MIDPEGRQQRCVIDGVVLNGNCTVPGVAHSAAAHNFVIIEKPILARLGKENALGVCSDNSHANDVCT